MKQPNIISFSLKKEENCGTCYHVDEPGDRMRVKEARHEKTHAVRFHLDEVPSI